MGRCWVHSTHNTGEKCKEPALLRKSKENVRDVQESRLQRANPCLGEDLPDPQFSGKYSTFKETSEGLTTGHIPAKCRISKHEHLYRQLPRGSSGTEREEQAGFDATVPGDHRAPALGAGHPGLAVGVGMEDSPAQAGLQEAVHHRLF